VFLGGFLIWNLDNIFCDQARGYRRVIGLPWGVVLEGHAWWHLMTGLGEFYPSSFAIVLPTDFDNHRRYVLRHTQVENSIVYDMLLTLLTAYYYIVWGIWLRHCLAGHDEDFVLKWPSFISIPEVRRASTGMNGKAKAQ
jgi:dihydroceramidase